MTMPVTDAQLETLRSQLSGDAQRHRALLEQLDRAADRDGYTTLVAASFTLAVYKQFGRSGTIGDAVHFVADVRASSSRVAEDLDPLAAERIIRAALGNENIDDLDDKTVFGSQIILLAALTTQLDEAELNEFLAEARKLADQWLLG